MAEPHATPPRPGLRALARHAQTLLLAAGLLAVGGCGGDEPSEPQPQPAIRFENASAAAAYVGAAACTECHEEEAQAHAAHPHARSFGVVKPEADLIGEHWHEPSAMTYRMAEHEGALRVRGSLKMKDGSEELLSEHVLSHWIGSGDRVRQYAAEPDGFLMLGPLVHRAGAQGWQVDEECDKPLAADFVRPVAPTCVRCHAGRMTQVDGAENRFRFAEPAIGCERCHGPGALHVQHQQTLATSDAAPEAADQPDLTIANPAHMRRDRAMAICAQCHMSDALTVYRIGKKPGDWQAAQPWEDAHVTFRPAGRPDGVPNASHVDLLAASRCYQESDTLTCVTCHGAHGHDVDASETRRRSNAACAQCHGDCGRPEPAAKPSGEDCASCHMPATEKRITHDVFHDHRLRRPGTSPDQPPGAELAAFLGDLARLTPAERVRAQGIAATRAAPWFRDRNERTTAESAARDLLEQAHAAGVADGRSKYSIEMLGMLKAGKAAGRKALVAALGPLLEAEAAHATFAPEEIVALRNLILDLLPKHEGPSEERRAVLERLITERRQAGDWVALARQRVLQGDTEGSQAALLHAHRIWPTEPGRQGDVAQLLYAQGDKEAAARASRIHQRLLRQQSYVAPRKPR